MRTPHHFVVVVIISLIVAAIVMLPRRGEQAAMLAGEGRHKEAIALMERRLADAPGDPELLAALGRSYAAVGETGRAIDTLDAYLTVRPDDLTARKRQAELLLHSGLVDRYLDAMARVVAAQPSPREVTGLVELYRLHGRVEDEITTLQAYAGTGTLEAAQLERLGALLAERGRWPEARRALELADGKAPPDASAGRFLLLEVLIQSNEADQAYERAKAWMMAWRSAYLSGRLILKMAQSGLTVPAYRLALDFTDMMPRRYLRDGRPVRPKGTQGPCPSDARPMGRPHDGTNRKAITRVCSGVGSRWRCRWTACQTGSARAQRLGPRDAGAAGRGGREGVRHAGSSCGPATAFE